MGKSLKMVIVIVVALTLLSGFVSIGNFNTEKKVQNLRSETTYINGLFVINQNTTDPLTGKKGQFGFDSNVIVNGSGTLRVENATMYFLSDVAHHFTLVVNGSLILYNSTLTIGRGLIQPYYSLNVQINGNVNPNAEIRIEKSSVLYSGWFNVSNKNSNIIIKDSVFDEMSGGNYGPTPYFYKSTIIMENTRFYHLFEHPSSETLPIGNMTDNNTYTSGNSDVHINKFVKNVYPGYSKYWSLVPVKELDMSFEYTTTSTYDNTSQIQLVYGDTVLMDFTFKRNTTGTFKQVKNDTFEKTDLTANNIWDAYNNGALKVILTPAHTGKVTVKNVTLKFFIERNVVLYGIEKFDFNLNQTTLYGKDIYIGADFELGYGTTHNRISLYDNSHAYLLNLTVKNTPNKEDSCIFANDYSSQVYILRYGNIKVSFHGFPIDGLYVNATPYTMDSALKQKIVNAIQNFSSHMNYGNINGNVIWDKTVNGEVYLPLLSDIVNKSEWPNSRYVGIYNISVNNETKTIYKTQIGLSYFPWLLPENNTYTYNVVLTQYKDIDIGTSLSITTPSPYISGNSIALRVYVKNHGSETAYNVYVKVYVNGNLVNQSLIHSLTQQTTENYVIPGNVFSSDGEYNISAISIQKWDYNAQNNMSYKVIKVGRLQVTQWNVGQLIRNHATSISVAVDSYYSYPTSTVSLYMDSTSIKTWTGLSSGINDLQVDWVVNAAAGAHVLRLYVNTTPIDSYNVYIYKDVDVGIVSITTNPTEIYMYEATSVSVKILNNGTDTPTNTKVNVQVFDPYNGKIADQNFTVSSTGESVYSLNIMPLISGYYLVKATVISSEDYNSANNMLSKQFVVKSSPYSVSTTETSVVNGTNVKIDVTVASSIAANLTITMKIPSLNITLSPSNFQNKYTTISSQGSVMAEFVLTQKQYQTLLKDHTQVDVMYLINIVSNRTGSNNVLGYGPYYFIIKEKADFGILQGSLLIEENNQMVKKVAEGVIITIKFSVQNTGGITENVTYSIKDTFNNKNISVSTGFLKSISPGDRANITYNYTIKGIGNHVITVTVDPKRNVTERKYSDNAATTSVDVVVPTIEIHYSITSKEHGGKFYKGDHVIITVRVINKNASRGKNVVMPGVKVTVTLGALGSYSATTGTNGVATITFVATKTGKYTPTITCEYGGVSQSFPQTEVNVTPAPLEIPWLWIILVAIAIGIAVFFLYGFVSFRKEAKEYMICGNCGKLIPADSERCPYCGAVFEKEKVKCPDCGSWIDEDSKYCPICGNVFIGQEETDYDKFISLKERYDQYLEKYKEEARKYIGEEYTTEEFFRWWKTHPEYISFLEWMKRQEEEIEGETVKCPVCGALNPKGAKICRVCGSPLPVEEEEEEKKKEEVKEKEEKPKEKSMMEKYREEYEKIKHPGVVSFEDWVKRKRETEKEEIPPREETVEVERRTEEKPVREKVEKEEYIKCPVCGALNRPDAKVCAVCGAPLTPPRKEEKKEEKKKTPPKPVIKRKVIKKVIAVNKEEKR